MKRQTILISLVIIAGVASFNVTNPVLAQDSPKETAASAKSPESVQLSFGVEDVLKLVRGKVSDDVIIVFIQNSGRRYNLSASEIVLLKSEGASSRVLTTMINQNQPIIPTPPSAPHPTVAPASEPVAVNTQYAPTYAQPAPAAPVYVVPSSSSYYYPYQTYYDYSYPALSLGFVFGSGYYYGSGCGYNYNYSCSKNNNSCNNNNNWNNYHNGNQYHNYNYQGGQNSANGWSRGGQQSVRYQGSTFSGSSSGGSRSGGAYAALSRPASYSSGGAFRSISGSGVSSGGRHR